MSFSARTDSDAETRRKPGESAALIRTKIKQAALCISSRLILLLFLQKQQLVKLWSSQRLDGCDWFKPTSGEVLHVAPSGLPSENDLL